jgi:UDP:flavonoid glycosyltransferase YjiC (YdhE family)
VRSQGISMSFPVKTFTDSPILDRRSSPEVAVRPRGRRLRILFSCIPAYGHFHPLVGVASAAAASGHVVAFATAPTFLERIRRAGFESLGAGICNDEQQRRLGPEWAEYARLPPAEGRAFIFPRWFALGARAKVDDLLAIALRWQPDLIVHDTAEFAAPLVAALVGIPSANHAYGPRVPRSIMQQTGAMLAGLWSEAGLEPAPFGGMYRYLHLDICPPSLQVEAQQPPCLVQPILPVPFDAVAGETAPAWLATLPDRPTICVTLGTSLNEPLLFGVLLDALAGLDANIIATLGPGNDPRLLPVQPAQVHVERYIPQSLVLPRCTLVVSHGGSGTMLAALRHGLPMLLVPRSADQFDNAERCAALGVARRLLPSEITGDRVRTTAAELLHSASYARAAEAIRNQIDALPAPAAAVEHFENLVGGHATGSSSVALHHLAGPRYRHHANDASTRWFHLASVSLAEQGPGQPAAL